MDEGRQGQTTQTEVAPAQRHIIQRPRLYRLLDESNARIILLVAPAGYGKTTLARQWTSLRGRRGLWYRAGPHSVDPAALATGLALALGGAFPQLPRRIHEYVASTPAPDDSPTVLADILAENVRTWPTGAWLVVDDYQSFIQSAACEAVVARFAETTNANLLITSRQQPRWVSARRVLYGEAFEVARDELALNTEEAGMLLDTKAQVAPELVELSQGWPAVLGLAALLPDDRLVTARSHSALHDYFAQELFDLAQHDLRSSLPLLSLAPAFDTSSLRALFGDAGEDVAREATRIGLATQTAAGVEIHPLIKTFLEEKLHQAEPARPRLLAFARTLTRRGEWDLSFQLVERYDLLEHVAELVTAASEHLLRDGRLATLEMWLGWASTHGASDISLNVARAEVLLRRGEWTAAEQLAAATADVSTGEVAARAHVCAGRAAHLSNKIAVAHHRFSRALELTRDSGLATAALWGRVLVSLFYEDGATFGDALHALEEYRDPQPSHLLRIAQGRLLKASFVGGLVEAADAGLAAEPLMESVLDPFARTGFRNNLADVLNMSCRYRDGERVARDELEDAERNRLSFVVPDAYTNLAAARLGMGDLAGTAALLERVAHLRAPVDPFVRANVVGIRARLAVTEPSLDIEPPACIPDDARFDIKREALASLALAHAVRGDFAEAQRLLDLAEHNRGFALAPVRVLRAGSAAVMSASSKNFKASIEALTGVVRATGALDGLLCVTRGSLAVLDALLDTSRGRAVLELIARRSDDPTLRGALGIPSTRVRDGSKLSARERDVLQLASQGLTNNEIAARLYISSKTVKTHFQHIFEKLGARSRTDAVVRAKSLRLLP